jgi:phage shock protein PspC (stress-responsive transcriptional regulator)/heme/copper-type cytochrome/quinol oxidase subunit 2
MKKVININFQGRVIPIEETAYDMLKQYVESLRLFFADEEGKDEIINDIEGRIAELFEEVLKKGSTCINDADVNNIINSMGRPEDFDADEAKVHSKLEGDSTGRTYGEQKTSTGRGRLYRDENHKFLGGVCSGIANYFNVDPLIIRILFVLFVGVTFIPYLILWVAVPSSSSVMIGSQRKRLFRDTDNKMIAGVCSGLAQYFSVQVWIPRILFLIPFFSFVFRWGHWGWWDFPHFLSFSFSPGSIVIYIILWLVLPEAKSAADKLEMKGEKVDLNNIKSTIQGDLTGFKDRASAFGNELKERAQEVGDTLSSAGKRAGTEAAAVGKRTGGIGHVLGVLIKIFVYFFVGCILFAIVAGLFAVGVMLTGLLPVYSYVLDDGFQSILAWLTLICFIWVPVIAIVTWIIRRIAGKKGNSNIIRLTFLSLWILGIICFVNLIVTLRNDFRYRNFPTEQSISLANPGVNKLEIKSVSNGRYYDRNWFRFEPFTSLDDDTVFVKNIRLRIVKANGDSFQVKMLKLANGSSKDEAEKLVSRINFNVAQIDSVLMLDRGIGINRQDKFRNQQVIVTVAVPVGKRIYINDNIGWDHDVRLEMGNGSGYWDWENNEESRAYNWRHHVEYVMTDKGLERVNKRIKADDGDDDEENSSDALEQYRKSREQIEKERQQKLKEIEQLDRELQTPVDTTGVKADSTRYRYTPKRRLTASNNTDENSFPTGIHNVLMINYPY